MKEATPAKKTTAAKAPVKATPKKKAKKIVSGQALAFVSAGYNNTIISITDLEGNVIANSSPGLVGFKGSRKSTPYAATRAAEDCAVKSIDAGAREVAVFVRGIGVGRNAAVKGIRSGGLRVKSITDKTPLPHGGPTPRKTPKK